MCQINRRHPFYGAHDNFFANVWENWSATWKTIAMAAKEVGSFTIQPNPLPEETVRIIADRLALYFRNNPRPRTSLTTASRDIVAIAMWQSPELFWMYPSNILADYIYIIRQSFIDVHPEFETQLKRREKYVQLIEATLRKFDEKRETYTDSNIKTDLKFRKPEERRKGFTRYRYRFAKRETEYAVLAFVNDALLNPFSCLWLPVTKQWQLSSAIMSLNSPKKISVANKGVGDSKRLARKAAAIVLEILDYAPIKLNKVQQDKFVSLFSMYWDWVTEATDTPYMTYGDSLIGVYADESYVHSCMSCNPREALGLYANNPDVTRILYMTDTDKNVTQRALIHKTSYTLVSGEELWALDRLYTPTNGRRYTQSSIIECLIQAGKQKVINENEECASELEVYKLTVIDTKNDNKRVTFKVFKCYENVDWDAMRPIGYPQVTWKVHEDGHIPYIDAFYKIEVTSLRDRLITGKLSADGNYDYSAQSGASHHTCWWEDGKEDCNDDGDDTVWSDYEGREIDREDASYSEYEGTYFTSGSEYFVWVNGIDDYVHIDNASYCDDCSEHYLCNNTAFWETIHGDYVCENCIDNYSECIYVDYHGDVETQRFYNSYSLRASEYRWTPQSILEDIELEYSQHLDTDDAVRIAESILGVTVNDEYHDIVLRKDARINYIKKITDALIELANKRRAEQEELCETE